jgi:hypothetical protein
MRARRCAALAICAAIVLAGCSQQGSSVKPGASGHSRLPAPLATSPHWLIAASAILKIDAAGGSAVATRYLDIPQTTIITGRSISGSLDNWRAAFALDTRSLQEIQRAVASHLSKRISMILYDPEHWSFTPRAQQMAVGPSVRQAGTLARQAGRELIATPATNLALSRPDGESAATAFLRTNDLVGTASGANWVEIQAQGLERNPSQYAAYIGQAVRQIRQGNPAAVIYAGLSTNPSGPSVDLAELIAAVKLTSHEVSGYWLNVPSQGTACPRCGQPQPQLAIELLESLR